MADIELKNVYTGLDQDYARRRIDAEWDALLRREAMMGEPAPGEDGEGPEPATKPEPEKPSAVVAGAEATVQAAGAGVQSFADGLRKLLTLSPVPENATFGEGMVTAMRHKIEAGREVVIDGLLQLGMAPLTGGFVGIGQALENAAPEAANAMLFEGGPAGPAFTLRHLMMGAPDRATLTPEQQQQMSQPMTVREALELIGPNLAPVGVPAARKAGKAVAEQGPKALKSQRGSVGPEPPPEGAMTGPVERPEGSEFRGGEREGAPGGGGPRPGGTGAPGPGDSRLNTARINTAADTKRLMEAISTRIGESEPTRSSRERVTHAETIERAREWNLERLLAVVPDDVRLGDLTPVKQSARDHYTAAAEHLTEISKRIADGDTAAEAEFYPAMTVAAKLAELAGMATETGRALEAQKIMAESFRAAPITPEALLDLSQKMRAGMGDVPPSTAAARIASLETAGQRRGLLAGMMGALRTGRNLFHELWINNLLTNPATHGANMTGTGLSVVWNLPERYTAEIVNRLFFRDPEGVQRGEAAAMVRAIPEGLADGIRLAGKAWKMETKGKDAARLSAVEADLLGQRPLELEPQLATWLRLPTIALGIEDAGWKGITYRMEIRALAQREAMAEGKRGKALDDRVAELEAHPPPAMLSEAVDQSMLLTLNRELGPTGQAFMRWANQIPGGRVILPFVRTPTNVAKWTGQRAPILAQLSAQNWHDMQAGGAARDKAIARQAIGAAVATVIAWEVANGNITGGGEPDRNLKKIEKGERPRYSRKIGNQWFEYSRTDPVGGLIGAVADYAEMTARIPTQDDFEEWAAYGETLALAVGNVMVNKTYMRGLADVLDAIKEPDRNAGKVAAGLARSIVPAGVRAVARQSDDNIVRDARTLVDQIRSGIPVLNQSIPPDRNPVTGEPLQYPPGWGPDLVSPIYVTDKKNDPVMEEILANRVSLSPVPRYIKGNRPTDGVQIDEVRNPAFKLTPEERDYWIVQMTQERFNGQTLHEALTALVKSEKYQEQATGPGGGRELLIKATYGAYRDMGYAKLLERSEPLRDAVQQHERAKLLKRLPRTDPRSPQFNAPAAEPRGVGGMLQRLTR